jgi:hypothetical protein
VSRRLRVKAHGDLHAISYLLMINVDDFTSLVVKSREIVAKQSSAVQFQSAVADRTGREAACVKFSKDSPHP